jgi:guanylate kinase
MNQLPAVPIVISGPSGAGKTTLIERLVPADQRLKLSVSVTTRPAREGEREGESYFFVSREKFEALKENELIEWAEVHGFQYGTPERYVRETLEAGNDIVLNIDIQGGLAVKKAFPEAVMIFMLPPSFRALRERIERRGTDSTEDMTVRMENARAEVAAAAHYEYLVINDDLDHALGDVISIISAERCRRERRLDRFLETFYSRL